ncbi:uncharacterized protein LOC143621261 [Bidens hawaiensis]|uniref:uncharacterized protein LOC143621261 n=1 Tax=Bidens hawaiensis TaxID=980011 RepID=UPI004049119A
MSLKFPSPIRLRKSDLTYFIAEKDLLMVAVATGNMRANFNKRYTNAKEWGRREWWWSQRSVVTKANKRKAIEAGIGREEKTLTEWKETVVRKLDGIELSLAGVRFRLTLELPKSDDFENMRKEWEEELNSAGYSRGRKWEPDTIVLRGVPSRWFAETRVSSKPSMLVTHTIFSALGKIRNLDVAEDDGIGKDADEYDEDVRGLQCKIVVRFEDHKEFSKALKVLCGRSLQKQGSRLKADYEVSWDKDGIFRNARSQNEETSRSTPKVAAYSYRSEPARYQSHAPRFSENNARSKRFKE